MVTPSAARRQRWRDHMRRLLAWMEDAHNSMKRKMIVAVGVLATSDFDDPRDNLACLLAARRSYDAHAKGIVEQFDQAEARLRLLLINQPDQHSQASNSPISLHAADASVHGTV